MRCLVLAIVPCLALALPVKADLVVEYDGLNGAAVMGAKGVGIASALDLTRGAGINYASGTGFSSENWSQTGGLAGAIGTGDYLSFGFTPTAGFSIDLTTVIVNLARSGTGPGLVELLSSIDGFTSSESLGYDYPATTGSILSFDVSSLTGITEATEFRLYAHGAQSNSGKLSIEAGVGDGSGSVGLQINGVVAAVPEPTAFLFGSLVTGLAGISVARRRVRLA